MLTTILKSIEKNEEFKKTGHIWVEHPCIKCPLDEGYCGGCSDWDKFAKQLK